MGILVTGGAGYIGSHVAYALLDRGESVTILDNLSTGIRAQVPTAARFLEGDVGDRDLLRKIMAEDCIESVLHFAGSVVVPESVEQPLSYYLNNTIVSHKLIQTCVEMEVPQLIFSSTAAIYSDTAEQPLREEAPKAPISPYARSKLMTEWILADAANAYGNFRYIALRYFNVAGADPAGRTGQSTPRATHLIKRACEAALGRIPCLEIFGTDFATPDGTGVRDYIHVSDLAAAHLLALDALRTGARSSQYNCGYGTGFSVREVIACVEAISGEKLKTEERGRRPGDLSSSISDPRRIRSELGWKPKLQDLPNIVQSAFDWEKRLSM